MSHQEELGVSSGGITPSHQEGYAVSSGGIGFLIRRDMMIHQGEEGVSSGEEEAISSGGRRANSIVLIMLFCSILL